MQIFISSTSKNDENISNSEFIEFMIFKRYTLILSNWKYKILWRPINRMYKKIKYFYISYKIWNYSASMTFTCTKKYLTNFFEIWQLITSTHTLKEWKEFSTFLVCDISLVRHISNWHSTKRSFSKMMMRRE